MTATMNDTAAPAAGDDFDRIATAFVEEDRFERDEVWTKLVEALTAEPFEPSAPERLVAPGIEHVWVGA